MKTIEDVKREAYQRLVDMGWSKEAIDEYAAPLINSFWKIIRRNWQGEPTAVLTSEGEEIILR